MFKNFRLQVAIRVVLLALTLAAAVYLWLETSFYLSAALVSCLVIYQTFRLIYYVELTNRRLGRFLDSIRYSDFSRSFSSQKLGRSFEKLDERFTDVADAFKEQRIETQVQFRYMQTVVQHIGIGLVSFNSEGKVELLNTAAKRLFHVSNLQNIDDLSKIDASLAKTVKNFDRNNQKIIRLSINNQMMQLAINATVFRLRDEMYTLVSFQDINAELEEKEMEAWQRLTQVLAHEIMNSVTPIASLSDTVQMLLQENAREHDEGYLIKKEAVNDVTDALDTIENRSEGLIRFVNSYRDFTKVPEPETELVSVSKLLERACNLNKGEAERQDININISTTPETLEVTADPHLIGQILINLIKNAFRAFKDQQKNMITLQGNMIKGKTCIEVSDNGPGIPPESLDKIFIPFYSTQRPNKQGGSGIGLSLSRQIMRAHGGTLTVKSTLGKGTAFTLWF